MRLKLFPELLINSSCIRWAMIAVAVVAVAWWLAYGPPAESSHVDTRMESMFTLQAPIHFAVSVQEEDKTAFREDEAGFSAYYRVPKRSDSDDRSGGLPRLNVAAITGALLDDPEDSNGARTGSGSPQYLGSNFGIVKLSMHPAVGFGRLVQPRNVMVYFDDRGWVVAYLPAGEPAAAIWRYDASAGGNPSAGSKVTEHLDQNLLVLAINEVLNAGTAHNPELSTITHGDVGYYDWQNVECNAFLLFNNVAEAGTSQPVNFVIPPAIADVQASTAVLITSRYSIGGDPVSASVALGRETVVTADVTTLLRVAKFDIDRPTDENGDRQTSLHKMSVTVSGNDTATGVVMLLYNKPG